MLARMAVTTDFRLCGNLVSGAHGGHRRWAGDSFSVVARGPWAGCVAGGGFPPSLACDVLRVAHGALISFEGDFGLGFGDAFPPRPRIFFDNGVRLSGLLGAAQRQLLLKPRRSLPPHGGITTSGALPMRCSPEPGESPRQGRH